MSSWRQIGASITQGPQDWEIIQQKQGSATISLQGSWHTGEVESGDVQVYVRIRSEANGSEIIPWTASIMQENQLWSVQLEQVPAGGLYQIEACMETKDQSLSLFPMRGDIIRHIGIGDLWVISGQSNAAGFGRGPFNDPPELGIHLLRENGSWDLAAHPFNEATGTIHEDAYESSNCGHSPYLAFGRLVKQAVGYPIGLIPAAMGGAPLKAWIPDEDGTLYYKMMRIIQAAGGEITGILWYQGESDTSTLEDANTYMDRFHHLVKLWRNALQHPKLPILTVQLNRFIQHPHLQEWDRKWGIVREMQRRAAQEIPYVYIVPSLDCPFSDQIHNSPAGNMIIGERVAKTALAEVYGKQAQYGAPQVNQAVFDLVSDTGASAILLGFEGLYGRLIRMDLHENPFRIEDGLGEIEIQQWDVIEHTQIRIQLTREAVGQTFVHGAAEINPTVWLPTDSATFMPMLAFYGLPVE